MPILPLEPILNIDDPVEEATVKSVEVVLALPCTVKSEDPVVVPTPTLPLARTVKSEVPVDDATLNGLVAAEP
jgi:hypothetical protein